MPTRHRRPAMYNTPAIRTGGFGALQVEAVTNRPLSIARRHLAASQLRMREIEPDELSSSEWVQFLVMEERERERWMAEFTRRRRSSSASSSASSSSSSPTSGRIPIDYSNASRGGSSSPSPASPVDAELAYDKAEEARLEAAEAAAEAEAAARLEAAEAEAAAQRAREAVRRRERGWEQLQRAREGVVGSTPAVSLWVRQFDGEDRGRGGPGDAYSARRPMHARRDMDSLLAVEAPPTYESVIRPGTPPPAYVPREEM